jgi:hypothetical protein
MRRPVFRSLIQRRPGALAAPGPAGLAGIEGKPIRGARPDGMIAAPH